MKTIHIYSDESRHKNERFLLLGGIWILEENIQRAEQEVAQLRKKHGYKNSEGAHIDFLGELKWTKVSDKYLSVYKEVVDLFFEWIKAHVIRSCVMLIDTVNPAVVAHSNIKQEGYFKLLFQLYLHNSKVPAIYKIYPDRITNPRQHHLNFQTLDSSLDAAFHKKFARMLNPSDHAGVRGFVNNITPTDSKASQFIQMIDVVMGAIGYYQNHYFEKEDARAAKIELMKYVFDKLIYSGSMMVSGKRYIVVRSAGFNIWLFRPKNKNSLP